jgi:glutaconate CoA-transferase subunit B
MEPDAVTRELTVTKLHPGISKQQITDTTEWSIRFSPALEETAAPTTRELETLRDLQQRTKLAHGSLTAG